MSRDMIRSKLIEAGVKNLKQFGYPGVTAENILTDQVYAAFFGAMLEDPDSSPSPSIAAVVAELRAEIEAKKKPSKKAKRPK